jgi:hypothetical protein
VLLPYASVEEVTEASEETDAVKTDAVVELL